MLCACERIRCCEAGYIVRGREHEEGGTYCNIAVVARRAAAFAQEWENHTMVGHELLICSKMCFTKVK